VALVAGIPLAHLFGLADTIESVLPQDVQDFIDQFVVVDHRTSHSDNAIFHRGTLQPVAAAIDEIPTAFDIGIGRLSLPLLQTGIAFQLAFVRQGVATPPALEAGANVWRLDLALDAFDLVVDGLEPAIYVPEAGTAPRHLVRDPSRSSVRITGSAVLRIDKPGAGTPVQVSFADQPDPLDPAVPSGAVASITCTPPHFFIGGSEFGLSVGKIQFDFSESYSPPDVIARGQGPGWVGVAIREATFYAPRNLPGLGDLSGGVKNVLIGSPVGLQGELEIQFGRSAMDPAAFQFEQLTDDGDLTLATSGSGDNQRLVTIEGSQGTDVTVRAGFVAPGPPADPDPDGATLVDWKATWTWPDGTSETGDTSTGSVRHGQVLRVTPVEVVEIDGEQSNFPHPEVTFRFVVAGTGPTIDARVGSEFFANTTHLGGTAAAVSGVTLEAQPGGAVAGSFEWQIEGRPEVVAGSSYVPAVAHSSGVQTVILREKVTPAGGDEQVRLARLRIQLLDAGDLLVGCEAGVFAAADDATALALAAVEDTFDLSDWHADGEFNPRLEQATLDPADATSVSVPADGLARVTIGPAPVLPADRHVQVLMDFDTANELRWGDFRPAGATAGFSQSDLLAWAARYPGARFIVIGRADDIGTLAYNATLAADRAARGLTLLTALQSGQTGTPVAGANVFARGEQTAAPAGSPSGSELDAFDDRASIELVGRLIDTEVPDSLLWPESRYEDGQLSEHEPVRDDYRRADIYAVGGTPAPEAARPDDTATVGPALRRSLVPAAGRDPAPVTAGSPKIDYRVKLRIVWDSPTVSELKDAIPTLAEAEFAWTPQTMPLPDVDGDAVQLSREVLTVFVNWSHDARTGYTKAALGIRSEGGDGLIATKLEEPLPASTRMLVAALAFGPALMSQVDFDTDVVGSGARVAALLAAIGFSTVDMGDGPLVADRSQATLTSAAFETEMRSIADPGPDLQLRVVTDYVCTLDINGGVFGIRTIDPMKVRYKRVGIEYDTSKEGWERFGLVYDTTSMEIEDPGRWEISGALGQLLRIVEVAMGTGSVWVEMRIAVALEIGIVEITEAIIRLTFHSGQLLPDFELRGFVLKADIPNVLEGEGRLRIESDADGNAIVRAGVDASIVPVGLGVDAALALAQMDGDTPDPWIFLSLFMGVQFATPLPLAQSGLAIYGFKGLFTMNGTRDLESLTNPDPVLKELDWWATPPEQKYKPEKGQFALGVGVVVGTLPDASFCVSCAGMLVVAFPDIEVILGVDVSIIEVPDTEASDEGGQSGTITGLVVIDSEAVKLAVSAQYTIPSVLEVKVPFAGYFPYPGTDKEVYVRVGSDGQTAFGRYGEPVTLKLLPGTLDAQAWTYLMIEQGGLPSLGGDERFTFEGFSVGFGAGWEIAWSAGPIKLGASAKVLVGFGTAPLIVKGGVFVAGELDLVVVSISARGELIIEAREFEQGDGSQDVAIKIEGEFCGEVDLWFFSLEGCVGVTIDLHPDLIPPAPPSPVKGISLTDRRDRLMGVASAGDPAAARVFVPEDPAAGAAVSSNNTVWPDTAPVIHFSHYVENAMPAYAQFTPGPTPTQDKWFGSNALKYAYRLDSIVLKKIDGTPDGTLVSGDEPLQSVWTSTPYRQTDASGEDNPLPSEHEGPNLKLLDWNPWAWVVNLSNGGAGQAGDPVDTVEDLCDPKPLPRRACVLGRRAHRAGFNRVRMRRQGAPRPPYPSRFFVTGEPVVRVGAQTLRGRPLHTLVTLAGGSIVPGEVVELPFAADVSGDRVERGYRLPAARRALTGDLAGLQDVTLPWEGSYSQGVTDPTVMLMICDAPAQGTPPGGADPGTCDDFKGLKPSGAPLELKRPWFTVSTLAAGATLLLVDEVDQTVTPPKLGADGSAEVRFPDAGALITLNVPCSRLEVHVAPLGGQVKAEALGADGRVLARDATPAAPTEPYTFVFEVDGLAAVRLLGGRGEAVLYKVCCKGGAAERACETFEGLKPSAKGVRRFAWRGLTFEVVDRTTQLRRSDAVDVSRVPPAPGSDGRAEVFFPRAGVRITLPKPCPAVEVHVMTFTSEPVQAEGLDAQGRPVAQARTSGQQRVPQVLALQPRQGDGPITSVVLGGGGGEAVVYRICCLGAGAAKSCVDFADAKLADKKVAKFEHARIGFAAISGQPELALVDRVDIAPEPDRAGRDQRGELAFGNTGLRITLPAACDRVELKLMLFEPAAVKVQALDATGARVWRGATGAGVKVPQVLQLDARGMRVVELAGGAGAAVLYEICYEPSARPDFDAGVPGTVVVGGGGAAQGTPDVFTSRRSTGAATAVTGIVGDTPRDEWPGRVLDRREGRDGRVCELVVYAPSNPRSGPWDGFRIEPPPGRTVTFVAACGIDQRAADARANDTAVAAALTNLLATVTAAAPEERREIVLEPASHYKIEVGWSWQAWQPDDPDAQPPATPPDAWTTGTTTVLYFDTAPDYTTSGDEPQDGLNEYHFDARDVDRYIAGVEPADGRAVQFTGDRIWVHFDAGHVEQLLGQYERSLVIEVRRTDPKPQPGADLSGVLAPLDLTLQWAGAPRDKQPVGYRRINDAIADPAIAPCLPDGAPLGGASLSATAPLEPDADYDLVLLAPKTGDAADRPVVRATRFHTSRYANPRTLLDALGYTVTTAPHLPDDLIVPEGMALPAGDFVEGDAALDAALEAIDAITLPLPASKPRTYVLWSFDALDGWRVEGLVVDSLEPLKRDATVIGSDGIASTGTRIEPLEAAIGAEAMPPWRANSRWTRVIFKPAAPVALDPAADHVLSLTFAASDSADLSGSRRLRGVPSIIEREGL
jgi:hypothetical protein